MCGVVYCQGKGPQGIRAVVSLAWKEKRIQVLRFRLPCPRNLLLPCPSSQLNPRAPIFTPHPPLHLLPLFRNSNILLSQKNLARTSTFLFTPNLTTTRMSTPTPIPMPTHHPNISKPSLPFSHPLRLDSNTLCRLSFCGYRRKNGSGGRKPGKRLCLSAKVTTEMEMQVEIR